MSYLNHNLPDWSCYIRNEFLYNHKKGQVDDDANHLRKLTAYLQKHQ